MARPLPPHGDHAHQLITLELVRLCLPHHGERPELQVTS